MSDPDEAKIYAEFDQGINEINEAKGHLENAKAKLGLCKICDDELNLLGKAAGDLSFVSKTAIDQMRARSMEGLKKLPSVAAGLDKLAQEAREASGQVAAAPASEESLGILPDQLRPTVILNSLKNGIPKPSEVVKGKGLGLPPMPHELLMGGSTSSMSTNQAGLEPRGKLMRPPLPHEIFNIDLPLPGRLFREATKSE